MSHFNNWCDLNYDKFDQVHMLVLGLSPFINVIFKFVGGGDGGIYNCSLIWLVEYDNLQ